MGVVSALAQCALDFLVEERCHACGSVLDSADGPDPLPALAEAVQVVSFLRFCLKSRLLCVRCARSVRRWPERVLLAPAGSAREPVDAIALYPAFVTDERLLAVIHLLKFGRCECLGPWLARAMMSGVPAIALPPGDAWHVVPVPMDRRARSRRGFNQAESIARTLAAMWQNPLCPPHALAKVRPTLPQSALGRAERLSNLDGAFHADPSVVRGARVVLVDDLVTTGATVRACASALRDSGALEVRVACVGYRDGEPSAAPTVLQS
jgi:ComF family protein